MLSLVESILFEYNKFVKYNKFRSSNIKTIAYDKSDEILQIKFKSGIVYNYYDFPYEDFVRMKRAKSKGKFLWKYVRDYYDYERIA